MNYSCLPAEGGLLKGAKRCSNSVGMDLDFDPTRPDYDQLKAELPSLKPLPNKPLSNKMLMGKPKRRAA